MKKMVDLLLINPGDRMQIYQSLGSTLSAIEPPIWAGLMATFLRNRGFSVQILDANAENLTPEETADRVIQMGPVLTAIVVYGHNPSASTQVMPSAGAICRSVKLRAPELKILLVGGHVASLPESTLQEEDADFVCGGEGPYTLVDLVKALKAGQPNYDKMRDLWYRDGETIRVGPPTPLVRELDRQMPGMAWDLLPMEKYRAHNWHCFGHLQRQPYASLYTTLGCPYHCHFCCIQAPFRNGERVLGYREGVNSYRFWSPEAVVGEIEKLVTRYGVRNIKIADEMFVLNRKHVHEICDQIIERGYDLNIWAYARVDTIQDEATLEKLRRAGFNWLAFGIEAGSDRVRDDVHKGFEREKIFSTLERVRRAGINIGANYIFGLPEDDEETMQGTLDLALELNAELANFYCAMAYPGSTLYTTALNEGWPLPDRWSGYSQHSADTLPLPTRYLTGAQVLRFRDHAFQVYFNNSRYLDMITRKFGPETAQHIREMASHKLIRRHTEAPQNKEGLICAP
jgi:anaerobic magnesium-protoporphyrin IX monomethyl ester cyclase